jgi:Periplasmic copper-binding protein (NosD)
MKPTSVWAVIGGTVIAAVGLGTPAYASPVTVVPPGGNIQQAIDAAAPGTTIQLRAGTYEGGVLIHTDRITLRGAGARTVLVPGAVDHCAPGGAGSGICVFGSPVRPLPGVRIESLTVRGFDHYGVVGLFTDQFQVTRVTAAEDGSYGIASFVSTRGTFTQNRALDNSLEAGIYIGDSPDAGGTTVADNYASGNMMGVLVRHAHNVNVRDNRLVGNCAGVALVDDGQAGGLGQIRVTDNVIANNSVFCPQNAEIPPLQGTGVVLFGGQDNTIAGNRIVNNRGDQPISSGVVLISGVSGLPASGNVIEDNVIRHNAPFDILDASGATNTFRNNACAASVPAGRCTY